LRRIGLPASVTPNTDSGFRVMWPIDNKPILDIILHSDLLGGNINELIDAIFNDGQPFISSITVLWPENKNPPFLANYPIPINLTTVSDQTAASEVVKAINKGKAPIVLLLNQGVRRLAPRTVQELTGWVLNHPEIAFASALVLLEDDTVVEAGRISGEASITQPLFRGTPMRHWGPFGGPLWYRNVSVAADTAIAFKRETMNLNCQENESWSQAFPRICQAVSAKNQRGLISPHARVYLEDMPKLEDSWHESMRRDRYFHPAFRSVTPLKLDH